MQLKMDKKIWTKSLLTTIFAGFFFIVAFTDKTTGSPCDQKNPVCGPECVATERILNLYGLYATASVIISLPRMKSVYALCFSRNNQQRRDSQFSDIFCMTGTMDEMQSVQPQHVVTLPGRVTDIQAFQEDNSQYMLFHTDVQGVQMYELIQQDRSHVSCSFVHSLGGRGSGQSRIVKSGHAEETGVAIATSSGKFCQIGDQSCLSPSVHTLVGETLTHCSLYDNRNLRAADLLTGWNDGTNAYFIFAMPHIDNSLIYGLQLFRLNIAVSGQCFLQFVQDILSGEAVCGIRSLEVVHSFDGKDFLLIARQPCPDLQNPYISSVQANILVKLWNVDSKQFIDSPVVRELEDTTGVSRITSVSKQFFVCQRESAPSTVHASLLPAASRVVSTVRINNQAIVKAVQSSNEDVFLTHVTSVGGVVVDWLSCTLKQQRPSNYSITSYGNQAKVHASGAYRNNTANNGKAISLESSSNINPSSVYSYNARPVVAYNNGQNQAISHNPQAGTVENGPSGYFPVNVNSVSPNSGQLQPNGQLVTFHSYMPPSQASLPIPTPSWLGALPSNYRPDERHLYQNVQNQRQDDYTKGMAYSGIQAPLPGPMPVSDNHRYQESIPQAQQALGPSASIQYEPNLFSILAGPPQQVLPSSYSPSQYMEPQNERGQVWQQQLHPPGPYSAPATLYPQAQLPQNQQTIQPAYAVQYGGPSQPYSVYVPPAPVFYNITNFQPPSHYQSPYQWPSNLALSDVDPNIHRYGQRHQSYRAPPPPFESAAVNHAPPAPPQHYLPIFPTARMPVITTVPTTTTTTTTTTTAATTATTTQPSTSNPIAPVQQSAKVGEKQVPPQEPKPSVQAIASTTQIDLTTLPESISIQPDVTSGQSLLSTTNASANADSSSTSLVTSTDALTEPTLPDGTVSSSIQTDVTSETAEPTSSLITMLPDTTPVAKAVAELEFLVTSQNVWNSLNESTTSSTSLADLPDQTTLIDNSFIATTKSDKDPSQLGDMIDAATEPVGTTSQSLTFGMDESSLSSSTPDIATTSTVPDQGNFATVTSETSTEGTTYAMTIADNMPIVDDQSVDGTKDSPFSSTTVQGDAISTSVTEVISQSSTDESSLATELPIGVTYSYRLQAGEKTSLEPVTTDAPVTSDGTIVTSTTLTDSPITEQTASDVDALSSTQLTEAAISETDRNLTSTDSSNSPTDSIISSDSSMATIQSDAAVSVVDSSTVAVDTSASYSTEEISQSTTTPDESTSETSVADADLTTTTSSIGVTSAEPTTFQVSMDSTTSQSPSERLSSDLASREESRLTGTDAVSQSTAIVDFASTPDG